jgi:sugar lactone lactonase YvrE
MKNNVGPDGAPGEVGRGEGILFRLTPDGGVTEWRRGLGISNTLCWSPDHRRFYFGDTLDNEIRVYDFDAEAGTIAGERPFFTGFERGAPDGSAMDAEGCVWNCRYGGGCVVRIRPDGAIDRIVEMPALNITTCTFGGPDLRTLLITTAAAGDGSRLAGSLFGLAVEVPGLPEHRARLA